MTTGRARLDQEVIRMSRRHRIHTTSDTQPAAAPIPTPMTEPTPQLPDSGAALPSREAAAPASAAAPSGVSQPVPHTRAGAAWVGLSAAALIAVALIVFLAQNTRTIEISFLWMTVRTSLAVALLIASVGSVLLTLILGTARITQLRRLARRRRT
jgi:uncharacterized integral membrane protein